MLIRAEFGRRSLGRCDVTSVKFYGNLFHDRLLGELKVIILITEWWFTILNIGDWFIVFTR